MKIGWRAFATCSAKSPRSCRSKCKLPQIEEARQRALELDRFCADVDQMIGINLLAGGDRKLFGTEVATAAEQHGMTLQADGSFHLPKIRA